MRANKGRFDGVLDELVRIKTEIAVLRARPSRPRLFYSVICCRPDCLRSASLVSICVLSCPLCLVCSSLTPSNPTWLRNSQCTNIVRGLISESEI